jgi:hypothetical protein
LIVYGLLFALLSFPSTDSIKYGSVPNLAMLWTAPLYTKNFGSVLNHLVHNPNEYSL